MKNILCSVLVVITAEVFAGCNCDSLASDKRMKKISFRSSIFSSSNSEDESVYFNHLKGALIIKKNGLHCEYVGETLVLYEFVALTSQGVEVITIFDQKGFIEFYKNPAGYPVQVYGEQWFTSDEGSERIFEGYRQVVMYQKE